MSEGIEGGGPAARQVAEQYNELIAKVRGSIGTGNQAALVAMIADVVTSLRDLTMTLAGHIDAVRLLAGGGLADDLEVTLTERRDPLRLVRDED